VGAARTFDFVKFPSHFVMKVPEGRFRGNDLDPFLGGERFEPSTGIPRIGQADPVQADPSANSEESASVCEGPNLP
jgi:hypothetical protein